MNLRIVYGDGWAITRSWRDEMKFDIYGRFQLEVLRENEVWAVYRLGSGTRLPANEVVIPAGVEAGELAVFLDDLFHELDVGNRGVREL